MPRDHLQQDTKSAEKWNDATVHGDRHSVESQAAFSAPFTALVAPHYRTSGRNWEMVTGTVGDFFDHFLTSHPVNADKHSKSVSYCISGKSHAKSLLGTTSQFAYRNKDKITAVTAVAIDIDGTSLMDAMVLRLRKMGYLVAVYTSHSHAEKRTATGDRFRIVFVLDEPFQIPLGEGRKKAIAEWEARYVGFCELIGLEDIDSSGMRPNQIMYPPRRPTEEAEFQNVVIMGRLLSSDDMPRGDASKYKKSGPRIASSGNWSDRKACGEPAILADGFNVTDWFWDVGQHCIITYILNTLGWNDRGDAGDGVNVLCPNDAAHSNAGDDADTGCWACDLYGEQETAIITCQHDHCANLTTPDMITLIGKQIEDGTWPLPDEYKSFSEMLCDPAYYPDEVDGLPLVCHPTDYGVIEVIPIDWLATPHKVKRAFKAYNGNEQAGDDHAAAIFAGVKKAGNTKPAMKELAAQVADVGWDGNEVKRLTKLGREMLENANKERANQQKSERRREAVDALENGVPDNLSMDIAEPLGETMETALATLSHRYVLSDVEGKFKVVRKPDLEALRETNGVMRSVIVAQSPDDFVSYHTDRCVVVGAGSDAVLVNPAKEFLNTQKRKSGLVFQPDESKVGVNKYNMYYGRTLVAVNGDAKPLWDFILDVVCKGSDVKFRWLMLWMAHMVQHPGEKPGTALSVWGKGGCGKGTFGILLEKLAAPHCRTLSKSEHIVGRFAGEHLSTCILAVFTEAAFAGDPRVVREMKALITQPDMSVEPKGLPLFALPSYLRVYIDSNSRHAVQIEGNGSERRYFVMQIGDQFKGDLPYWNDIYAHLEGDAMAALLQDLLDYDPTDHGFTWADVRVAPSTIERDGMRYQSLRPVERELINAFLAGEINCPTPEGIVTKTFDAVKPVRGASSHIRAFLLQHGDKRNADDGDVVALMEGMFGETITVEVEGGDNVVWLVARQRRGNHDGEDNVRFVEFPPLHVLHSEIKRLFNVTSETLPDVEKSEDVGDASDGPSTTK